MRIIVIPACLTLMYAARPAAAQTVWDVFSDDRSGSLCGVVNARTNELVVLNGTSQLMIVSSRDTILADTFVDAEGFVFLGIDPVGVIEFAEDADGFRTLWWLTFDGRIVQLDGFDLTPFASEEFPEDFRNIPCDACDFVDNPLAELCAEDDVIVSDNPFVPLILDFCGVGVGSGLMLTMTFCGYIGLATVRRR